MWTGSESWLMGQKGCRGVSPESLWNWQIRLIQILFHLPDLKAQHGLPWYAPAVLLTQIQVAPLFRLGLYTQYGNNSFPLTLGRATVFPMRLLRSVLSQSAAEIQAAQDYFQLLWNRVRIRHLGSPPTPCLPTHSSTCLSPSHTPEFLPLTSSSTFPRPLQTCYFGQHKGTLPGLDLSWRGQHTSMHQSLALQSRHKHALCHICNSTGPAQRSYTVQRGWLGLLPKRY